MERTLAMDCGDGVRRADNGCWGKGPFAKIADYTIPASQTGTIFTNGQATGTVVFTLPPPKPGFWFSFIKTSGNQSLIVRAPAGVTINQGAPGGSYTNNTGGTATVTVLGMTTSDYAIVTQMGNWNSSA